MTWRADAEQHARAEFPREACGLVVVFKGREVYRPCANIAPSGDEFAIDPADYAAAEDAGEIVRVVHSHCYAPPHPSQADLASCEQYGLPWSIIGLPNGVWFDFEPSGYRAPLIGREYSYGVLDCYTLIRDWYGEKGIILPEYDRAFGWWMDGRDLYVDNFKSAGFFEHDEPLEAGDVLLMVIESRVANHGAIYVGNGMILHHLSNRLSSRDVYGGYYQKVTTKTLRHENHQALR